MSEAANVRLVRCPKCSNLLPEVTAYSVYQCGGCGAVLRAKNNGVDLETFSEKSDEERVVANVEKISDRYEKSMNLSDQRRMMDMSDGSESDVRSNVSFSGRAERRRIIRDRAEHNRSNLSSKESKWDAEPDPIQDKSFDNFQRAKFSQGLGGMGVHHEGGFVQAQRTDPEMMGYAKEGPSNLLSRPVDADDFNNSDYVGDDRAELLRKLDELKYQISRSGNLMEKGKEKVPLDRRMPQSDPYMYDNVYNDAQFRKPATYQNQYAEPTRLMQRQEMAGNGFYHPQYALSHPIHPRSQMLRRGPHEPPMGPTRYQIPPPHAYVSGPYMDDRMAYTDTPESYPSDFNRHHPSCSCYQCYTKRRAPMYSDEYADDPSDGFYTHLDTPGSFGSRDYNQRITNPAPPPPRTLRSRNAGSHTRWPSDVTSELDGFALRRPPKVHLASGGKTCRPIAGGAPFLTCYNCFELLLLPKKVVIKNTSTRKTKIRCGACAIMIDFAYSDKKIVVSMDAEVQNNNNPVIADNKHDILPSQIRTAFSSEDYDNSGYDFLSMDRNSKLEAEENAEAERKDATPADPLVNDKRPPPPSGSSLQDYFEYSNIYNRSREENKVEPDKLAPHHVPRKESSATEIDLSSNEYSNTGTTFNSGEGSRDGDRLKAGRVAESFFAGIIKKSFKDSSNRSNENFEQEKASVTVNGHLIPDRLIKKAEKLAGTIHPGHYWYDFRAGFWGAVGGPCLGIVPPFIEEFNYPMPEHCAGGNTHVFVNGRELHQKDLNLLGSRGLLTERDRSYIVEISGRVLDEDTGEELPGLGKLAPTVERLKRGFGMKAPQAAA